MSVEGTTRSAAIELRLRALRFRDDEEFVPTAVHMDLPPVDFEKSMVKGPLPGRRGRTEEVGYSITKLCGILKNFAERAIKDGVVVARVQASVIE